MNGVPTVSVMVPIATELRLTLNLGSHVVFEYTDSFDPPVRHSGEHQPESVDVSSVRKVRPLSPPHNGGATRVSLWAAESGVQPSTSGGTARSGFVRTRIDIPRPKPIP